MLKRAGVLGVDHTAATVPPAPMAPPVDRRAAPTVDRRVVPTAVHMARAADQSARTAVTARGAVMPPAVAARVATADRTAAGEADINTVQSHDSSTIGTQRKSRVALIATPITPHRVAAGAVAREAAGAAVTDRPAMRVPEVRQAAGRTTRPSQVTAEAAANATAAQEASRKEPSLTGASNRVRRWNRSRWKSFPVKPVVRCTREF